MRVLNYVVGTFMVAGVLADTNIQPRDPPNPEGPIIVYETEYEEVPGETVTVIHMPDPTGVDIPVAPAAAQANQPKPYRLAPPEKPKNQRKKKPWVFDDRSGKTPLWAWDRQRIQAERDDGSYDPPGHPLEEEKTHGMCRWNEDNRLKFAIQIDAGSDVLGNRADKLHPKIQGWHCKIKTWEAVHFDHDRKTAILFEANNGIPYMLACEGPKILKWIAEVTGSPTDFKCVHAPDATLREWFRDRSVDERLNKMEKEKKDKEKKEKEGK